MLSPALLVTGAFAVGARNPVVRSNGTVSVVLPETPVRVAVMVVLPPLTPVATPVLAMVATAVLEELQVTWVVRFWVLLSE